MYHLMMKEKKMQNRVDVQLDNFPNAHKMVNDKDIQNNILDEFFSIVIEIQF